MSTKKAIISVTNDLYTDNRVHKTCTFLQENGFEVTLVGRRRKSSVELPPRKYRTKRFGLLFDKGPLFYAAINLRLFLYLLFHKVDLLVANDLDTLLANYWAKKFKRRTRLVYDTHELFTEVPELNNRPKVQRFWLRIEKRIFPTLETIITVNQSIADIYAERYGKKLFVVRNVSPRFLYTEIRSKEELGLPIDRPLLILQGAGINIDRGGEELIEAMKVVDAVLMIVGDGDVLPQLKARVKELEIEDKVLFFGRKPYSEMMQFTKHADIGFTLDKPTNMNYRFSLPNKVFDYAHAGTAIISTDIKEVAAVIHKYNVGRIVEPFNSENLASEINSLLNNRTLLAELKANTKIASENENWESESQILTDIYCK